MSKFTLMNAIEMQCLRQSASALKCKYPEAAESLETNTYMDDNSDGRDSIKAAAKLLQDSLAIMDSGGFHGHKIAASHPDIVKGLDDSRLDKNRVVSVLGLKLDFDTNEFMFNLDGKFDDFSPDGDVITRRNIVAVASRIFDTQGFVSPYIMKYKQILPLLWANNTGWDENLVTRKVKNEQGEMEPDPVAKQAVQLFREWFADIPSMKELRFTRYIPGKFDKIAIFGDASFKGIGVVAYMVKMQPDGSRKSQIMYSKSTLMPKDLRKKDFKDVLTIARAELIALTCCVTMSTYIQNALQNTVTSENIHIFTDSLLNLQRIQRGKGHCKPWEERRVRTILANKHDSKVHFCPGKLNPSDLPSRGTSLPELIDQLKFWKEGPPFLLQNEDTWPKQPVIAGGALSEKELPEENPSAYDDVKLYLAQCEVVRETLQVERRLQANAFAASTSQPAKEHPLDTLLRKFSSLRAIKGAITAFRRAQAKVRKQPHLPRKAPMSPAEEITADRELARHIQAKHFATEVATAEVKDSGDQSLLSVHKSSTLKNLPVYWDKPNGLLRLKSRLHKSLSLDPDFTNPVVLPKCDFSKRLAVEMHHKLRHASQKQTYEQLRLSYWIQGGYTYIKSAIRHGCKTPRCRYIKFETPKMSPLPTIRLDKPEAWAHVGVDYFGPLYCIHDCDYLHCPKDDQGRKCRNPPKSKAYGAVFTCMHTRSLHVELVLDATTSQFLMAFRRFSHTRGRPISFYSDNATNFKCADKQLQKLFKLNIQSDVEKYTYEGLGPIEWKYSTELAPWTNGCTERLVGIFKKQLSVALQKRAIPFRQMETLCIELTFFVNERPLGQVREGDTERMITPNMLTFGRSLRPIATPSLQTLSQASVDSMWEDRKRSLTFFWTKWQADYLAELSVDNKWFKGSNPAIKPGDVVIMKPETQEKGQWRLARILDIQKDLDGNVKKVSVQLPNKTVFTRASSQIALLEPSAEELEKRSRESPASALSTPTREMCGKGLMETDSQLHCQEHLLHINEVNVFFLHKAQNESHDLW